MSRPMRAVIPAGGFGTRMLPATKSMPKEMLPVLDKPVIQWVVEEAAAAGIGEIVVITGRHKKAIEDHFDSSPELEAFLHATGRDRLLPKVRDQTKGARLFYVRQESPKGLGHAILMAAPLVRDGPFAVLLGDDIITGRTPPIKQLAAVHAERGASVFCVQRVPKSEISRYGVVRTKPLGNGLHEVLDIVEKPTAEAAPSDLAVMGRYLFTPGILAELEHTKPGAGGEIQLTDAIQSLLKKEKVYCLEFEGVRHDIGTLEGWLAANVRLAAQAPPLRAIVQQAMDQAAEPGR